MDAQLKKGILEMCMLSFLEKESLYGYDIIQRLHVFFPEVGESAFYAVLRRLNKEGLATTFLGEVSNGPVRKYYRLTDAGKERLSQMREDWRRLEEIVRQIG